MVSKKDIIKHLAVIKMHAIKNIQKQSYHKGLLYLELYSKLAYQYNLFYTDDIVEKLLNDTSKKLLIKPTFKKNKERIVFYDSFSIDNRGLTQQYLKAIMSWGYELLYITNANDIGKDIMSELKSYQKVKIKKFNSESISEYNTIIYEISSFSPEKAILHMSPWDISGFLIWNCIDNIDRFLVNLTDHAFWLGKSCSDYFLEFRRYGINISINERFIPFENLLLQPYYPIINNVDFKGFPFKTDKLIAFSGSNLYKIAGRNNEFLKIIKDVLNCNENLIFVLAGPGNQKPIYKFILENNLQKKFFIIGDRKDISALVENIDIYVNTYPMIGGLMTQYAAFYNKPIIGYTSADLLAFNDAEDFLQIPQNEILVKTNKNDFVDYFQQLIENEKIRNENINLTKNCLMSPDEFNSLLFKNINNFENKIKKDYILSVNFNKETISSLYIEMENQFNKMHYNLIYSYMGLKMILYFPFSGIMFFLSKISKVLCRKINKCITLK